MDGKNSFKVFPSSTKNLSILVPPFNNSFNFLGPKVFSILAILFFLEIVEEFCFALNLLYWGNILDNIFFFAKFTTCVSSDNTYITSSKLFKVSAYFNFNLSNAGPPPGLFRVA